MRGSSDGREGEGGVICHQGRRWQSKCSMSRSWEATCFPLWQRMSLERKRTHWDVGVAGHAVQNPSWPVQVSVSPPGHGSVRKSPDSWAYPEMALAFTSCRDASDFSAPFCGGRIARERLDLPMGNRTVEANLKSRDAPKAMSSSTEACIFSQEEQHLWVSSVCVLATFDISFSQPVWKLTLDYFHNRQDGL